MFILQADDKFAYLCSLSNLYALKVLHDAGLNVTKFSDFMVYPNTCSSEGLSILFEGLKGLFEKVESFSPYDGEEDSQYLVSLVEHGVLDHMPECAYVIKDERISKLLNSPLKDKVHKLLDNHIIGDLFDGDIVLHPENDAFIFSINVEGDAHEAVEEIVSIHKNLNQFMKELIEDGIYRKAV